MTSRGWNWAATLAAVDVLAWVLTIHAHESYHRAADGPTVMPLGQLLGWIGSIALVIVIVLIVLAGRQSDHRRR